MTSVVQLFSRTCWRSPDSLAQTIAELVDRVEERDRAIQAFLPEPHRRERLLAEVDDLNRAYPASTRAHDNARPALFGVPVGIKDLFHVDGFETRAGGALPADLFAGAEASVVTRLREQGALIFGKTVATEFAFAEPGPTRNPHNLQHTPGGSSSGSAAAVATGFVPLTLGTQTIGSVARPASFCGVVGFKPSYGRIPADGCVPFSVSVDHVGFFTPDIASVETVAAALVPDWNHKAADEDPPHTGIGWITGPYWEQCEPEMKTLLTEQVDQLTALGANVQSIDLFPDWQEWVDLHYDLIAAEFAEFHAPWFERYRDLYRPRTIELIERGQTIPAQRIEIAQASRLTLRKRVMDAMKEHGISRWITPSAIGPAPAGLDSTGSPLMNLPWSYTGLPTVTMPSGNTKAGLPLGIQWVGSYGQDEMLVRQCCGEMYEHGLTKMS